MVPIKHTRCCLIYRTQLFMHPWKSKISQSLHNLATNEAVQPLTFFWTALLEKCVQRTIDRRNRAYALFYTHSRSQKIMIYVILSVIKPHVVSACFFLNYFLADYFVNHQAWWFWHRDGFQHSDRAYIFLAGRFSGVKALAMRQIYIAINFCKSSKNYWGSGTSLCTTWEEMKGKGMKGLSLNISDVYIY